jgi:large subunit ribosomal protein L32e
MEMTSETKRLIRVREEKGASFKRDGYGKKKQLSSSWRKPRGLHNKQRKQKKAKGPLPKPGYGSPVAVRGMHPSGFFEVLVASQKDLDGCDPKTQAIRIAAAVGNRKRVALIEAAAAAGFRVLNARKGKAEPKKAEAPKKAAGESKEKKGAKKPKAAKSPVKKTAPEKKPASSAEKKEEPEAPAKKPRKPKAEAASAEKKEGAAKKAPKKAEKKAAVKPKAEAAAKPKAEAAAKPKAEKPAAAPKSKAKAEGAAKPKAKKKTESEVKKND